MPVLRVDNLRKSFGRIHAVDGVSFAIEPGEIYGLLGPNGAGKTTTISMIAQLLRPDGGAIAIGAGGGDVRRRFGLIPQEVALTEKLTARETLQFVGRLYDLRGADLNARVERALQDVGLADRATDRVHTFSGGMKRRMNIAAGLLHDPQLLLLDEPTAGVDPQSRAYIFDIVRKLAAQGAAVLYTTHYMEEAQRLCRRIAIMDRGRILAEGTLAELVERAATTRELHITVEGLDDAVAARLATELGEAHCERDGETLRCRVADGRTGLIAATRAADRLNLPLRALAVHEPNLESVFLQLTGRALRD